ncbi:MAG: galactose-1-phosphate uridylyltransferase, partial [Peptostreptococcaceae bacterium]
MREMKRDLITNDIIVIAKDRSKRPMDKIYGNSDIEIDKEYEKDCPFCRGNEKHTEKPTFELNEDDGWIVRSVYNKYPIVNLSNIEISG